MARMFLVALASVLALIFPTPGRGKEHVWPGSKWSGRGDSRKTPPPPMLFHSKGCSSSTATQALARAMLKAHGTNVWASASFEDLQEDKMRILTEMPKGTSVLQGLEASILRASSTGKTYMTKMSEQHLRDSEMQHLFHQNNARIVNVWRSNVLDYLVCSVNDCFLSEDHGQQVLPNGTQIDLCFRRRHTSVPTQVKLNTKTLVTTLSKFLRSDRTQAWALEQAGYRSFLTVATEDLLACGRKEDLVPRSVDAWAIFLSSLGIHPDRTEVRRVIHERCEVGTRPLEPHSKNIYNIKQVANVLRNAEDPRIRALLREL